MAKYRIVGLPKAQRGSSGITGGPEYDSRYGMMGKLGYENEFRGQKDRSNINTLSADIYGGNFGIGASGAYEFGSEKRGGFPAKNFMKTTIGGDNVRGFYGDIKGGSEIHAIKDRNNQLNFTPFGGVSVQSRPGLVTGAADNLGSKAGLNYGIGTDYTRKFKNDGLFNLYGQVMFNPVLGKNASNEALKSGNVNLARQFNIGARYTIPLSSNSRKIKKLIAKQNEDRNEIVTPVDFVRSTENVNPILRPFYKKYGGYVVEDLPKAQVGSSGGQWKQNPDGSWIQMADDWVAPSKKISPLVQRQQDINAGIKKAQIKQPVIYENLPKDEGNLKNVAQQYIGGPDLKTVSDQAMFRQQQEAEKKEAVAQHYYAKMVQEFPGFTIEQAREDVNNPGYQHNPQKIGLGEMFTQAGIAKLASNTGSYLSNTNTGKFKWEDYYNREGLGQAWRPGTIREITDAEKKENEQSWQGKLTDIAYNPFTAAGFWARGQKVPDNMQRDMDRGTFGYYANGQFRTDRNPLDMITDVTILGAAHSADRILDKATNDVDGDFWTMQTGFDALNTVFHANMLRGATKLGKTGSYYDDVMGSSTAGRNATDPDLLNLGYNPLQKTLGTTEDLIKFTDDVPFNKGLGLSQRKLLQRSTSPTTPVTPSQPSWSLIDPSTNTLQIKSTMKGSPFEKQLSKTGQISVSNITAHINKQGVGMQDKYILQKTLDEVFPGQTKIDYNEFKAAVSDQIVPLEKSITDNYADVGLEKIGYGPQSNPNIVTLNQRIAADEQRLAINLFKVGELNDKIKLTSNSDELAILEKQKADLLEQKGHISTRINEFEQSLRNQPILDETGGVLTNETIKYGNTDALGLGDNTHFNDAPLGHTRILVTKAEPDVIHVLESQSDYYQSKRKLRSQDELETKSGRNLENAQKKLIADDAYYQKLKSAYAEGKKIDGQPVHDWQIAEAERRINASKLDVQRRSQDARNPFQKQLLGKTHEERLLQENMLHAVEQGQTKMRYPTSETAANIQGYTKNTELANDKIKELERQIDRNVIEHDAQWTPSFREVDGKMVDRNKPKYTHGSFAKTENGYEFRSHIGKKPMPVTEKEFLTAKEKATKEIASIKKRNGYKSQHVTILKKYDEAPKMIKKTIGQEVRTITDAKGNTWYEFDIPDDALWGNYEMKSLNTEDWINKNGPGMFGKLKNKLKRKPKVEKPNAPETKLEGTYQDIAVQKIIKDATIDIPKAREQYFAGSNLFDPLTPSGSGFTTPLYKLPEGIDQQEFDMFASQVSAGKVPTTAVNAVFQAMIKVNPSLAKIKNVPKEDIINYASGHMPPDQIEEVHKAMSSNPWETDAPNMSSPELGIDGINPLDNNISLKNFTKDDGSVIVDPLESLNLISQQFKGSLKKGRKAAINEGNQSLHDWIKHPATQKKISNLYKTQRDKLIQRIDRIENQVKASEEAMQEIRNLNNDPLKSIVLDSKKLNETNALNDEYAETAKKKINELWDKIDKLDKGEREALSFTPDSKYYPLSRQVQDFFSKNSEQIHSGNKGVYYGPKNKRSGSWISRHPQYSFEDIASTTMHEGTHQWTKANAELDQSGELDIIFSNINPKLKSVVVKWTRLINDGIDPATKMGADLADWGYVANPTEVHARIMQLREHFKLKPGQEVTPEMAQNILTEIKKGTTPITRADKFARIMTDAGSFANLFNGLRVMVPIAGAVGVGAATQEQDGGFIEMELSDDEIAEYRKGGYIVDEM